MLLSQYISYALLAFLLPSATFGRSILSIFGDNTQSPLLKSGCDDGTGIVDPDGKCNGTGVVDDPIPHDREGFKFENPSTDCKYASQPHIWDSFKHLEKDMSKLFTLIHKNVSFTVVGHHPIAGRYHDLMHFYVNALRRVSMLFFDHADLFEIHPRGIYGGCNAEWSVEEVQFKGVMNSGDKFDITNVWFTRWYRDQMVEIRTYIDAPKIMEALHKNEIWWNGTTLRDNLQYMPGPAGMPDLKEIEGMMGYPDGRKYQD
ncbi:uncharacterized protein N7479_005491 [Penicillium vulpinum]|uniref:SnoaL-like domain-containing protein n=1 Tax=Penicillium vulpinum TaxID=29845 RepID=A0A1V6SF46_9EURO|nr:uncharacterized protein N7479_005491 [Penicillium vulpinum]KAJ5958341.1 hypothetical protein N7479_005491 [Penicillium vulpinum]OQE12538.1 hypothetical protein PENVUL_c001G02667 [Penicillium vulpinum]